MHTKKLLYKKCIAALASVIVIGFGCGGPDEKTDTDLIITDPITGDTLTDTRDGRKYRIVEIGSRTWMASNLNHQLNGGGSWCYGGEAANCDKYGRLYDWDAARRVCPAGWRLSTNADWDNLVQTAGGDSVAGKALKSKAPAWNGDDTLKFSALPGGARTGLFGDGFSAIGEDGYWWTATEDVSGGAYRRTILKQYAAMTGNDDSGIKTAGYSVRCVKN